MSSNLAWRLIHAREASGFVKVKPAAEKAGITPSALYQLESGKSKTLSGDTAQRLAGVYRGFRIEWLINGTGPQRSAVADEAASYDLSQALRIDPETIAAALKLVRLSFLNLKLEIDQEVNGTPLAYAYEYLLKRQERAVTAENVIDFSARLEKKLLETSDDATRSGNTGGAGRSNRKHG